MLLRLPQPKNRPEQTIQNIPNDAHVVGINDVRLLHNLAQQCAKRTKPYHIYCCDSNPEKVHLPVPSLQGTYSICIEGVPVTLSLGRPPHVHPSIVWLTEEPTEKQKQPLPYYSTPQYSSPRHVDVIGAGISGLVSAYVFAQKGMRVRIFDRHNTLCGEASGNPHALVYANLSPFDQIQPRFYLSSLFTGIHALSMFSQETVFHQCGILCSNKHNHQWSKTLIDTDTHIQQKEGGLWLPGAGVVHPHSLAKAITSHPNISWYPNHNIEQIAIENNKPVFYINGSKWKSEHIVICTSHHLSALSICDTISVRKSSGQLSYTKKPISDASYASSDHAYLTPYWNGVQCFGSTYHLHELKTDVSAEDHQNNIERLTYSHPSVRVPTDSLFGRCGIRAQTNNFLPIAGPLPAKEWYTTQYAKLKDGVLRSKRYPPAQYLPNVSVHVGHGSKGFSQAWLCAEILAAQLTNRPLPVDTDVYQALHPARFLVRAIHKGTFKT